MAEIDRECQKLYILSIFLFDYLFSCSLELKKKITTKRLSCRTSAKPEDSNAHKTYYSLTADLYSMKYEKTSEKGTRSDWVDKDVRRKLGFCRD